MGQYYYGVIIDKDSKQPIMAAYCGKLTESNRADMASFAYELSKGRKGYMQRLVWAGDYSSQKDYDGQILYHVIGDREEKGEKVATTLQELADIWRTIRDLKGEAYEKAKEDYEQKSEAYWMEHIYKANGDLRDELRYLCNHDRREYMDLNAFPIRNWEKVQNPLPILFSDPTCRIKGGGDYMYQEDWQYYSLWYGCVVSTEKDIPEGYKEIAPRFEENTEIWTPDSICELIHGTRYGYRMPAPNAETFGRSICHYDEAHIKLACVPREVILGMYADWQKKVDCERVYKAYDLLMRAIKKDPKLEQEHKGLKLDVRKWTGRNGTEYSDTYAIVDEVEMKLYGPYEKGWECYMHHQASLYGIEYDCDLKSRRHFRKLIKERQAVA